MAFVFEPQSQVKLLNNTKLTNDYLNQLDFDNVLAQSTYFLGKVFKSYSDFRYLRRGEVLQVPENYERLYSCDYVMFKNTNFGEKWFYAFIVKKEYVNDKATNLYIEIDSFQTWQFEIEYFPTYISRSHQREFIGTTPLFDNLYPEQLEYGRDYVVTHTETISWNKYYAVICSACDLRGEFGTISNPQLPASLGGVFDGLPSALDYYVVDNINNNPDPRTSNLYDVMTQLSKFPWIAQNIQSITVVPEEAIGNNWSVIQMQGLNLGVLENNYVSSNFYLTPVSNFLNHFPNNYIHSKMFTYPYSFIEMTCYNGAQFIIKPEGINGSDIEINLVNYIGAQPRLAYYINGYNDFGDNGHAFPDGRLYTGEFLNASIVNGNFPQLPVMMDNYALYMANNSNSFQLTNTIARFNQAEGVVGGIAKALTGNIGGGIASAYSGIKQGELTIRQQNAKVQDAELNPPSLAGQSGGDAFNISNSINGITLKWKTVRPQYADRLQKYFERYGYVQNVIKTPQLYGMSNFNYLQTTNIMLAGNIPDDDRNVIKRMFDNGVTIWHNGVIGNYTSNEWVGV